MADEHPPTDMDLLKRFFNLSCKSRTHPTSGLKVLSGLRLAESKKPSACFKTRTLRLANLNLKLFEHLQQKQIYLQLVDEEVILQKVIFDEMLRLGVRYYLLTHLHFF